MAYVVSDIDRQVREAAEEMLDRTDFHILVTVAGDVFTVGGLVDEPQPKRGQVAVTGRHDDPIKFFARFSK
jgi:hypothetical protein